jgi:FdhD protein
MTDRAAVVAVRRVDDRGAQADQDLVAAEAPLSIVVSAQDRPDEMPLGILMRTPGDDRDLVIGLLHAEGVIRHAADVHRWHDTPDRVHVVLGATADVAALTAHRGELTTSACGLCGRLSITRLDRGHRQSPDAPVIDPAVIASIPRVLQSQQAVFAETGGLHAAGLFDADGTLRVLREDVGRHNAVDKTIGAALTSGLLDARPPVLAVSGRVAYEIVQKAAMAAVPIVAAVGSPSSLAVDAARAAGLTLIGFVRGGRFNVYTHSGRIHV